MIERATIADGDDLITVTIPCVTKENYDAAAASFKERIVSLTERAEKAERERNRLRAALDSHVNDLQTEIATQASRIAELQAALRELLDALSAGAYTRENGERYIAAKRKARELLEDSPKAEPEAQP